MAEAERATMRAKKNVVLIAHDSRKADLLEWVRYNRPVLAEHALFATGTTGALIAGAADLPVTRFKSGPLGGDQQVGANPSGQFAAGPRKSRRVGLGPISR